jgi:hypothetical protein
MPDHARPESLDWVPVRDASGIAFADDPRVQFLHMRIGDEFGMFILVWEDNL